MAARMPAAGAPRGARGPSDHRQRRNTSINKVELTFMDRQEQKEWISNHIPHRVRAAIARLRMEDSLLGVSAFINPIPKTEEEKVYWRCATDSIWEGRLAATRWLIEFVGIQRDTNGNPPRPKWRDNDACIDDFEGGRLFDLSSGNARILADVWKGCTQASSHATKTGHPSVCDRTVLPGALKIVLDHLQETIYDKAGMKLRDFVLVLLGHKKASSRPAYPEEL